MLIGWSLINSCIPTPFFLEMQERIALFKQKGLLPVHHRIAIGQKCLDEDYRGKGIVEAMTSLQDEMTASKYDTYLATVNCKNLASKKFFIKNDFTLFYTDDVRHYFIKPITSNGYQEKEIFLGSDKKVVIRAGKEGDEIELHELNKKWWSPNRNNDLSKGFLSTLYTPKDFKEMISRQEIAVADIST